MSVTLRKPLLVRFVDAPIINTPTTRPVNQQEELNKKIEANIRQRHEQHLSDVKSKCTEWVNQHIIADADSPKKYYTNKGGVLSRIKVPAMQKAVFDHLLSRHTEVLEGIMRRLRSGLEAKGATVALVCDTTQFTQTLIGECVKRFKDVIEALSSHAPKVQLDKCKDCVVIGNTLYHLTSRGTLVEAAEVSLKDHYHTRRLPPTFPITLCNKHIGGIATPLQVLFGSALLGNRVPHNTLVSTTDRHIINALTSIGGTLVAHIPMGAKHQDYGAVASSSSLPILKD
jgi:hypothetical protein